MVGRMTRVAGVGEPAVTGNAPISGDPVRPPQHEQLQLLSIGEQRRLDDLEQVIDRGLQTFREVGLALLEIRDTRLYRQTHATFEGYCDQRWQFTDRRARQLMAAAEIGTMVPVENERQARELVPLLEDEAELIDVWHELRERHGDRLTAAKVREAVEARLRYEQNLGAILSSGSTEWYTPARYVDAARDVLGAIDLDPASCEQANRIVQAADYYDVGTDGLEREWLGRVFCNPPYGQMTGRFVTKALAEHADGRTSAVVLLVNAYGMDADWFQPLWEHTLCFTNHRIAFYGPQDRGRGGSTFGSVFVYLGARRRSFAVRFAEFGAVVERVAA